ncbi:uncharacterized protein LOC128554008 isoform X2 [Mercenaria mercenaria]|uniref:uncharacterized protein LOC128554008 isoform X2 n=1 Tax=Mercenaria mercenaria TaxID=6596 RepID=UPI00234EC3A6|nr:uncharacterized protein LOC128554008 isoform X2 [Mercenaria mercenaria]
MNIYTVCKMCWFVMSNIRSFLRWIVWWWYYFASRCCGWNCVRTNKIYLLDPENGNITNQFTDAFRLFVDSRIKTKCVHTSKECVKDYPIALLCRRQTDRAEEDIGSVLKHLHTDELYGQTVVICMHVITDTRYKPSTPTWRSITKFKELGIVVDFGFIARNSFKKIYACNYKGSIDSENAFNNFVRKMGNAQEV